MAWKRVVAAHLQPGMLWDLEQEAWDDSPLECRWKVNRIEEPDRDHIRIHYSFGPVNQHITPERNMTYNVTADTIIMVYEEG